MQKMFSNKNSNAVKFLHMDLVSASFHDIKLTLLVLLLPFGLGVSFLWWLCSQRVVSIQCSL